MGSSERLAPWLPSWLSILIEGEMFIEKVQEKVQVVTNVTGPIGAGTATVGALTLNEWMALGGFLLALLSFLLNWYYQHKRYEIEKNRG